MPVTNNSAPSYIHSFYHNGMSDHPDRTATAAVNRGPGTMNVKGFNGEWMDFPQDGAPYYPGEVGNDPFLRSKYALSHIWREWPGMAGLDEGLPSLCPPILVCIENPYMYNT